MNDTVRPWWLDATFYSIFPLGFCGAPARNPSEPLTVGAGLQQVPESGALARVSRITAITEDLERVRDLGFTAVYLGPLFESDSHGYDTRDYFTLDRRLGADDDLAALVQAAHDRDMRVVVDGVYNHVGRGFWAFQRLLEEGAGSEYASWFAGVDFSHDNRFGDGFVYHGWEGVEELVTLNHTNPAVRNHLLDAAEHAVRRYGIDGIRLDVAYSLPFDFLDALSARLRDVRTDAWLMGEVIHGDYGGFLVPGRLDSVTNYECFKGLWSSFNDRNLHEIGHSLSRLFGDGGLLADALASGKLPFGFADNHDVSRLASTLATPEHLYPLYALLWTMPGIPSVYYGSEYAMEGRKEQGDAVLRPDADSVHALARFEQRALLARFLAELNRVRARSRALREGGYRQVSVASTSLVFERAIPGASRAGRVVVAVNAEPDPVTLELPSEFAGEYRCLRSDAGLSLESDVPRLEVPAYGFRVLERSS